jgi:hypothetical protein
VSYVKLLFKFMKKDSTIWFLYNSMWYENGLIIMCGLFKILILVSQFEMKLFKSFQHHMKILQTFNDTKNWWKWKNTSSHFVKLRKKIHKYCSLGYIAWSCKIDFFLKWILLQIQKFTFLASKKYIMKNHIMDFKM